MDPSPPATTNPWMPSSHAFSAAACWISGRKKSGNHPAPMMVPPCPRIPATEQDSRTIPSPLAIPLKPLVMPQVSTRRASAALTTARIQAFIPGASPPEVINPILWSCVGIFSLSGNFLKSRTAQPPHPTMRPKLDQKHEVTSLCRLEVLLPALIRPGEDEGARNSGVHAPAQLHPEPIVPLHVSVGDPLC